MIELHNTLSGKKEEFIPLSAKSVGMYNCGPTVYNFAHIGNLRSYVMADTIRRVFEYNGYEVKQVINITDVGHIVSDDDIGIDKVEKAAREAAKNASDITGFYTDAFMKDLALLNIETEGTIFPRATHHIPEQIALIEKLEQGGHVYKTSIGIYFDTATFKDYGKLGNIDIEGLKEGARVEINNEKRNPTDFALWKFSKPEEKRQQEWLSPWGIGFPGWHIECSAMSMKYLGETFDIHTGGIDHIPVHHNNEIAQSESATGKRYVNYWLHNAFVNVTDGKMSKSLNNFLRLQTLIDEGISPLAYRYWLLGAHYATQVAFSLEAVKASQTAYDKLLATVASLPLGGVVSKTYVEKFEKMINDNLDTPNAIALLWNLVKDSEVSAEDKKATILHFDRVLGLDLGTAKTAEPIPEKVITVAHEREEARKNKDWKKADELRDMIDKLGYNVKDGTDGFVLIRK